MKLDIVTKNELKSLVRESVKNLKELDLNAKFWKDRVRSLELNCKELEKEIDRVKIHLMKVQSALINNGIVIK